MSSSSSSGRQRTMGGGSHLVLDYLKRMQSENPSFFYALQTDNDHSVTAPNVFWADITAKLNYSYFGDTLTFDTSYRSSRYRLPFASFTGINHHGHPVLFGSAFIFNESESAFIWLFQTWLHAMSASPPVSITTDPDSLLQVAVQNVFPQTRHRYCKFAIFRETRDKLAHLYHSHPTFDADFRKCVNEADSVDDFESAWQSLLQRYYVMDNEWLQSLYNVRQQWVPVFLRNTFFGDLSERDGIGALNSFFESYVNASTTMQVFIKQYEKAVADWLEKEAKADHDTTNSTLVLKTPSPMEKQAANIYTRRIFIKFQEELVETLANPATKIEESGTLTTYRVAKFGEEHKAHTVGFNSFEMKASCSCQMFEYSGIICRHILAVFRAKNVLTLPSQYVLKRWTRDAKRGDGTNEQASELPDNSRESLSIRYNSLRQEAVKYVEEGAKSIHIYNVAMHALQEAAKKVAAVKNQNTGAAHGATLTNGSSQEPQETEEQRSGILQSADEKEKRIRELTAEIESTNQRCEVYRANLLAVLKDMEEQKLKLSVKVQNARLSLKE